MLALTLVLAAAAVAAPDDRHALAGVSEGKVVFDVNMSNPAMLALYLDVIEETRAGLVKQDVRPDIILAFRGASVRLVLQDVEDIDLEHHADLERIAAGIERLRRAGVRMEACSVATRLFGVDHARLLPGITPVGNTFISLTGYQARGYAIVPIM